MNATMKKRKKMCLMVDHYSDAKSVNDSNSQNFNKAQLLDTSNEMHEEVK